MRHKTESEHKADDAEAETSRKRDAFHDAAQQGFDGSGRFRRRAEEILKRETE